MELSHLEQLAKEAGFSHIAPMRADTIELKPEVREMCAQCHQYDKRWSCPPGCGTLDENRAKVAGFTRGILVQTVGELEDELDGEAMIETEHAHKDNFRRLHEVLVREYPGMLALGAGCCTICKDCAYPDAPCRFPEKMVSSMEAFGMVVMEVCKANDLPYYYGANTIAYTSCFLLE